MSPDDTPPTPRMRLRRGAKNGRYDRARVTAVLDAGIVAHLGVTTESGPIVIPMAYGHDGEHLYLHGAAANAALGEGEDHDVCVTVTVVDGLIFGRSPFHNSMRYRSCVVRGTLQPIDDPADKRRALKIVADHVVANWDSGRPPTDIEIRRTTVNRLALTEASVKLRVGEPTDEPGDTDTDHWAGVVPIEARWGRVEPAANLRANITAPAPIAALTGMIAPAPDTP